MIGGKRQMGDPENPGFGEQFHKHPLAPSAVGTDPTDGLPRPTPQATIALTTSPPLTKETFVCMGDLSRFVIRDQRGQVVFEFEPLEVQRAPNGQWFAKRELLTGEMVEKLATWFGRSPSPDFLIPVEPIRPQCSHYRRTLVDMQGNPEHRYLERVCMAARDENGQFITINDTRVHACELREPRDFESESRLDAFDEKAFAKTREETSEFDLEAALAAENAGGIFSGG